MSSVKFIFTTAILIIVFALWSVTSSGQKRGHIWCWGHNAAINFNGPVPLADSSAVISRGSCATISDKSGNIQFYVAGDTVALYAATLRGGKVYSKNHLLMQGGDSLITRAWYNEQIIIPQPDDTSLYYVVTAGVTSIYGLYYSIVDLSQNGGLGAVVQKNIQLQSFANVDCINAIKHGNGRDWWVLFRKSGVSPGNPNNEIYQYLITPSGISSVLVQSVGSINSTNLGKFTFSPLGDKLVYNSYRGMIEMYDYSRCTGDISNPVTIFQETINPPFNHFWGCEFSPNGNILYVTISDQTSYLFQFDLTAPNIATSIDTLWATSFPGEAIGALKRGPDNKIYESGPYTNPAFFAYPYPDSVYNMYNMNLGVINSPDNLGAACDFQPYSFYLGGKRTYWGLPNNPDYELGPLAGSICDTLTAVSEPVNFNSEFNAWYSSEWEMAYVNANGIKGKNYLFQVTDMAGKTVLSENGMLVPPFFTRDVNMKDFAKGLYVVSLITDREKLTARMIKY